MSKQDNGGPAFPSPVDLYDGKTEAAVRGMTLRDYFASRAPLESLQLGDAKTAAEFAGMAIPTTTEELIRVGMACAARASYIYADAMLAAREAA